MTTHQIFVTSKLRTKYPDYFTNSANQKYVSILSVYLFKDGSPKTGGIGGTGGTTGSGSGLTVGGLGNTNNSTQFTALQYCQLHADFVQDDECLEQYVCMANVPLYHKRKYKQYNNPCYFNVWFTDYKGTKIEINELDPKNPYHFVVELLLEY